jgi:hypothetical protein
VPGRFFPIAEKPHTADFEQHALKTAVLEGKKIWSSFTNRNVSYFNSQVTRCARLPSGSLGFCPYGDRRIS